LINPDHRNASEKWPEKVIIEPTARLVGVLAQNAYMVEKSTSYGGKREGKKKISLIDRSWRFGSAVGKSAAWKNLL